MTSLRVATGRTSLALAFAVLSSCSVNEVLFTQGEGAADARVDGSLPSQVTLQVSSAQLALVEGRGVSFGVSLSARPAAMVSVTVTSGDPAKLGVSPALLTFSPDEFSTPQMVGVVALDDPDAADESVQLSVAAAGLPTVQVAVAIDDNDGLAVVTSPALGLEVTEGLAETLEVRLSAQPASPVTTMLMAGDGSVAGLSPSELTFTPTNWNVAQPVTVTGRDDANLTDDMVSLSISGSGIADLELPIKVFDDDVQGIVPSPTSLGTMVEEGGTRTVAVRLSQVPSGTVLITAQSSAPGALAVVPAAVSFTVANWNMPQTLTVTALPDADLIGVDATIRLNAAGLPQRFVTASVVDNDVQSILVSRSTVSVPEGQSTTIDVRLAFQPAADTTVTVSSADPQVVGAAPTMLVFSPTTYATPLQVTLTGVQDPDAVAESTVVRLQSGPLLTDVAVDVIEDETLAIDTSAGAVSLGENGNATFGARLTAMPLAPITVAVASSDPGAATVAPAQLTFDGNNWNTYQTVTVTGVADEDVGNESVVISLSAGGLPTHTVSASVVDDDVQELILSATSVSLNEGGSTTVTARLRYQPDTAISLAVSTSNAQVATATPATLSFTTADYATPKPVTVTAVQDANAANDTATITISRPGLSASVAVAVTDDDTLAILASSSMVNVVEGSSGFFTVRLTAQPLATTTVTVASADASIATVTPASLTFTAADWATPQTVTVTGVQDPDAIAESTLVMLRASGLAGVDVTVSVAEDDALEILPTVGAVSLGERGQANFAVRLGAQPPANVTVSVVSGDVSAATVSPATLTFTPTNWSSLQAVTVFGVNDPDADHEAVAITLSAPGLAPRVVTANLTDDDTLGVLFSVSSLSLPEGALASIGVYLGAQPSGNVTVTVTTSDPSAVTVSQSTYTFTPANYNQFQQLNLRAEQDADATSETVTIAGMGAGLVSGSVTVNVADDDPMAIVLSAGPMSIGEAGTGTFTVRLSAQPDSDVAVQLGSSDVSAVTVSPTSELFTPGNWNQPRTITLSGVNDSDLVHERVTIEARTMVGIGAQSFFVDVADDDLLSVSPPFMRLCEGESKTLSVTLGNAPFGGSVTVTVAGSGGAVGVSPLPMAPFTSAETRTLVVTGFAETLQATTQVLSFSAPGLIGRAATVTVLSPTDPLCQPEPACGDGSCNGGESTATCPQDCGSSCGDGVCNGGETSGNCPEDCGGGGGGFCGDGTCSFDEGLACNCEVDCGPFCR